MLDLPNKTGYIAVIGGANADITGSSSGALIPEDSNPGQIHICPGGVGRNIAENLARLRADVKLICAIGGDSFGRMIIRQTEAAGVDMSCCHIEDGKASSAYMAILDNDGEMKLALSDMRIAGALPLSAVERHRRMLDGAELLVLDANLPVPVIRYVLGTFPSRHIMLDPVSAGKAKRIRGLTGSFDTIKMNRLEAEFLSGREIKDEDDLLHAGQYFISGGTGCVFITLGSEGVFYRTGTEHGICNSPYLMPANATGAGDALTAGIAYCAMQGHVTEYAARFACAMARIALRSTMTVSPDMSVENVLKEMKTGILC